MGIVITGNRLGYNPNCQFPSKLARASAGCWLTSSPYNSGTVIGTGGYQVTLRVCFDLEASRRSRIDNRFPPGPNHLDFFGERGVTHHHHRAVLGPITGAGMDLAQGSFARPELEPDLGAYSPRIARRSSQLYTQSRFACD